MTQETPLPPPSAPPESAQVNVDLATVKNAATMIAKKYPFSECYQIVLYLMRIGKEADEQLESLELERQKAQAVKEYQRAQDEVQKPKRPLADRGGTKCLNLADALGISDEEIEAAVEADEQEA